MSTATGQLFQSKAVRPRHEPAYGLELLWLPLGARGHFIRIGGKVYETVAALLDRRGMSDIYHSVLNVRVPDGRFVIEMGPVVDPNGAGRGVVVEGPVASALVACFRIFRYEVRCWRDGVTAYDYAVDSPTTNHRTIPNEPSECSSSSRTCRPSRGVEISSERARCGRVTLSPPGCSPAADSGARSSHPPVAARQAGPRGRSSRGGSFCGKRAWEARRVRATWGLTSAVTLSPFASTG